MTQDIKAWMTEDGERVVTNTTKEGLVRDGGASATTMQPFTVPLVRQTNDAACAAIEFAMEYLDDDHDVVQFLNHWNQGDFDILRRNWPEAPEEVYIGADPLHPQTVL